MLRSEPPGRPLWIRILLTVLSLLSVGVALEPFAGLVGLGSFAALVGSTLLRNEGSPEFPQPKLSFEWLKRVLGFVGDFVGWAVPLVPFAVPFVVFVAVTWPLASESASLQFQQQAAQIIPLLLIGFVLETGALEWRGRPVNWILSLMTS